MTLGQKIKTKRKELNLTQSEFGKKIGVTIQQVWNYETGKQTPTYKRLQKINKVLNLDLNL